MELEFRTVHSHWKEDAEHPSQIFAIEYRYGDGEWQDLEVFNEKVATIVVDALNNYQKQNQEQLTLKWSKATKNEN